MHSTISDQAMLTNSEPEWLIQALSFYVESGSLDVPESVVNNQLDIVQHSHYSLDTKKVQVEKTNKPVSN